jgi:hypothetical protein
MLGVVVRIVAGMFYTSFDIASAQLQFNLPPPSLPFARHSPSPSSLLPQDAARVATLLGPECAVEELTRRVEDLARTLH